MISQTLNKKEEKKLKIILTFLYTDVRNNEILSSFSFSVNCSSGQPAFVRRPFVWLSSESLLSEFIIQVHESPPSACFGLCAADRNCSAYFVDYRNQSCLIVKEQFDLKLIENKLVKDTVGSYHRKICLPGI